MGLPQKSDSSKRIMFMSVTASRYTRRARHHTAQVTLDALVSRRTHKKCFIVLMYRALLSRTRLGQTTGMDRAGRSPIPLTPRAASPPPRRSRPYPRHGRCTTGRGPSSSSSIARPSTVQASTGGASICAGGSRGTVPCQAASTIAWCGLADAGRAALTHPTAPAPTPLSSWAEAGSTSHLRGPGSHPCPCPR